jgi:hypothetical protein
MEPIADSEIKRVLVVNAHPDDSDFGASGTIAQWVAQGIQDLLKKRCLQFANANNALHALPWVSVM